MYKNNLSKIKCIYIEGEKGFYKILANITLNAIVRLSVITCRPFSSLLLFLALPCLENSKYNASFPIITSCNNRKLRIILRHRLTNVSLVCMTTQSLFIISILEVYFQSKTKFINTSKLSNTDFKILVHTIGHIRENETEHLNEYIRAYIILFLRS